MNGITSVSSGLAPIQTQQTSSDSAGTIPATVMQTGDASAQGSGQPATPDQLQKAIDRINRHLDGSDHSVRVGYVRSLHRLTVEVVDNSTGQVVGQFPSKSVINSEIAMNQYIGMILSKEA